MQTKNGLMEEPRHLTTAAIKTLQDCQEKNQTNKNLILQIVRMRDLNEGKASAAKNGASSTNTKKASIKYK